MPPQLVSLVKMKPRTQLIGQTVHFFRELPSTNDIAKELSRIGAKEGTVVLAETQTEGKGRLGRTWISHLGGLWFSVVLRPRTDAEDAPKLTLLAAVAVAKAFGRLYHMKPEVKWPNDVLINGKKICGILTEASSMGRNLNYVVIGFGINANFRLSRLPVSLRGSATTLQDELGKEVNIEMLFRSLLEQIERYYLLFRAGKFSAVLDEWRRLAKFLGSYVQVTNLDEKVEGWAMNVDEHGALILKLKDRTTRRIIAGDVTLREYHG